MNKVLILPLFIAAYSLIGSVLNAANPVVDIMFPSGDITVYEGSDIYVRANATDADGIDGIRLYLNGSQVRREGSAPYEWGIMEQDDPELQGLTVGTYTLMAEAEDNVGDKSQDSLTITVVPAPPAPTPPANSPNYLLIVIDEFRYDMIRYVQDRMPRYDGKTKVRTPSLDRIINEGVYFKNSYTHCAVCGPARGVLRTGLTLENSGIQANDLTDIDTYPNDPIYQNRIEATETFEMVLVEDNGYNAEHYGKWHMPPIYNYTRDGYRRIMRYNDADLTGMTHDEDYANISYTFNHKKSSFDYATRLAELIPPPAPGAGEQINTYSKFPYQTVPIDVRHGETPGSTTPVAQPDQQGRNTLPANRTSAYFEGTVAVGALDRLAQENHPFVLTASFHSPHSPFVASGVYYDYFDALKDNFYIPPSLSGADLDNTGYNIHSDPDYRDPEKVKDWMVAYYALCEEVDIYIGKLLDKLDEHNIANDTLVVVTTDHGEALGSHGRRQKSTMLEESGHNVMLMRFPGRMPAGLTVEESVSTLDIYATALDYLGFSTYDNSNGKSLRRFIEKSNYNETYDEEVIVTEWDHRTPNENGDLDRSLGGEMNFMSKKGKWKFITTKKASSTKKDMLYNLEADPYEMNNLLGDNGMTANDEAIGKTEHLKAMLVEWMQRMDGPNNVYSDPVYNEGEGMGDIAEVDARRRWRTVDIWVSDTDLEFGSPVSVSNQLTRNEYIYLGRTNSGTLTITDIRLEGNDAAYLQLSGFTSGSISSGNYERVKVTYLPNAANQLITDARVVIENGAGADRIVELSSRGFQSSNPAVSFASPSDNTFYSQGENIEVLVNAIDGDDIDRVYLFLDGIELARSEGNAPFEWGKSGQNDTELENMQPGTYELRAMARDTLGNEGEATINITVLDPSQIPPIYINFQPASAPVPSGYLADSVDTYGDRGNGYTYGWDSSFNGTRDRENHSDQRYDTLNHTQHSGIDHYWEIEVPNGQYDVSITGGDPSYDNSFIDFVAEMGTANETTIVSGSAAGVNFLSGTERVTVSDGRLTIRNGTSANNNKICFIDIVSVPPSDPYEAWKTANSVTDDNADDDGDGISNLMEFALGGDPNSANSGQAPQVTQTGSDFEFRFPRAQESVTYVIEKSSDLSAWTEHITVSDTHGTVGNDAVVTVSGTELQNGKLFLRLRSDR